ncbi:MAG: C39 family peptidase [Candidatus Kerfeldbacteria bacterium]|nr:C39 family peptidase [Candidatus Kerfeldbacteria bacterium]
MTAASTVEQYRGAIVSSAEDGGLWYVYPARRTRLRLDGALDPLTVIKRIAVGMSNTNLDKIPLTTTSGLGQPAFQQRWSGYFLVQVQDRAQLWYVNPAWQQRLEVNVNSLIDWLRSVAVSVDSATLAQLPTERNLTVPFTPQAPHGRWDKDHSEFCEEASVAMVSRYLRGRTIRSANDAEAELQRLKRWELKNLGYHYDTSAAATARIVREVYKLNTQLAFDPSASYLREIIDTGHPVIVPVDGRQLRNPFFRRPWPDYHMVVVKGYTTDGRFIVHEPGTRRGRDYLYSERTILRAMHDYNNGDPARGAKIVLIASR